MSQDYYELSMRTLQLAGMSERTQENYHPRGTYILTSLSRISHKST